MFSFEIYTLSCKESYVTLSVNNYLYILKLHTHVSETCFNSKLIGNRAVYRIFLLTLAAMLPSIVTCCRFDASRTEL